MPFRVEIRGLKKTKCQRADVGRCLRIENTNRAYFRAVRAAGVSPALAVAVARVATIRNAVALNMTGPPLFLTDV